MGALSEGTPEPQKYARPTEGGHSHAISHANSHVNSQGVREEHVASEPLVFLFMEPPFTLERLLQDEKVVSLAAEFLGLRDSEIGWNRKGYAFAFGPVTRRNPNGIYTLPEMFAAKRDGLRRLTSSENAVWGKRLFVEMGLIDPVPVEGHEGYWLRGACVVSNGPQGTSPGRSGLTTSRHGHGSRCSEVSASSWGSRG